MTDITALARQFTAAYATVAPLKQALDAEVRAAREKMKAFARANSWGSGSAWEFAWFVEAEGITFDAGDIEEAGIYLSYSIGQEYPTENFLPFEVLTNLDHYLAETAQRLRDQRAFDARVFKERKRADLKRQLAALDADE